MACSKKDGGRRKRLPSVNPFFHFLKCLWKKHRGCKRSTVVKLAVKRWKAMTDCEKQPYYDEACRAQKLHRKAKKNARSKQKCKPKRKSKSRMKCPKPRSQKSRPRKKKPKMCCPPCPPCPNSESNQKKC